MTDQTGAKVDYQDFDDTTVDFVKKLKRVFADINIRIAAVEAIKTMADEFERRYGQVALDRIDAGISPVLAAATEILDQARADLAAIDAAYRQDGAERVDAIINPLIAAAQAALIAADEKVAELEAFLGAKQSVAEKGQADGYAGLDANGKVPAGQLPALVTTATVGAALAGASQEAAPAVGDRLAGIKAGGSSAFWVTLGNLKAALEIAIGDVAGLQITLDDKATAAALAALADVVLHLEGGVMTGPLMLAGDPTNPLEVAPKQYVDRVGAPSVVLEDRRPSGVKGGGSTAATWNTRTLNTKIERQAGCLGALSGNRFDASVDGWVEWSTICCLVGYSQTRLYNVTDSTVAGVGMINMQPASTTIVHTVSGGGCAVEAGKTYELQEWAQTSRATVAFGDAASSGAGEVYARLKFWKV